MSLKLISLNIEGDNHYDRIFPFFEKEQPDIICVQEFFLDDLPLFEEKLAMTGYAVGMWTCSLPNTVRVSQKGLMGVAIFSKLPLLLTSHAWYVGEGKIIEMFTPTAGAEKVSRALLWADVEKEGKKFRIATTHFTWSPAGSVTDIQRRDIQKLLQITDSLGEQVLSADFNAPRGTEIFSTLSSHFKDNIPPEITTSIDQNLHRRKGIQFMVDGLFTTKTYTAKNVEIRDGVSDHCAIVGEIYAV
jgi:endonuclease/exonuclease/phosphatase family metal-dependent hydrolase